MTSTHSLPVLAVLLVAALGLTGCSAGSSEAPAPAETHRIVPHLTTLIVSGTVSVFPPITTAQPCIDAAAERTVGLAVCEVLYPNQGLTLLYAHNFSRAGEFMNGLAEQTLLTAGSREQQIDFNGVAFTVGTPVILPNPATAPEFVETLSTGVWMVTCTIDSAYQRAWPLTPVTDPLAVAG